VDLADEAVEIDHQRALARTRARLPRARKRDVEHAVELADMPKRERRKNVPNVEGAITRWPTISCVDPARSRFMSSMLSAPASIPWATGWPRRSGRFRRYG
jgi:hypothetical protein